VKRDRLAWFPFYPGDWISSCFVSELRPVSRAFYVDLMSFQWTAKGAGLPSDSESVRKLARASKRDWAIAWPELEDKFPIADNGRRYNERMAEEWERAGAKSVRQKAASQTANRARWGSVSDSVSESISDSESGPPAGASPSPSPSEKEDVHPLSGVDVGIGIPTPAPAGPKIDWTEQAERWNTIAVANGLPVLRRWSQGRRRALRSRLREEPDFWGVLTEAVETRGEWAREHGFPTFDQAVRPSTFAKLVEGNYRDNNAGGADEETLRILREA